RVSLSINHYYQFYKHSLLIPNEKHISLHYGDYTSMDIEVYIPKLNLNLYDIVQNRNDPVPEVINNTESESVAELKNNFIEIQSPDYQIVSETIIKVQHGNLNDADEQIDYRIIEIQQKINIAKDIIKGDYYNFENCFKNMHKEIGNLLEKIDTENTYGIKEVAEIPNDNKIEKPQFSQSINRSINVLHNTIENIKLQLKERRELEGLECCHSEENLDDQNESDLDIANKKLKEYNDYNCFFLNNIVANLEDEKTKLIVQLSGSTACKIWVKQVSYSRENNIKPPGRLRSFFYNNYKIQ
ncbi:3527_t:CDS:2, partial [Gigaspora margarita]